MAADRTWMYRQPRVWETFLSGVNGFLAQAEADMRDRGVPTMCCPCVDCLNQKKFGQRDNIFHHLITRGFKENYTCWNQHGEEGLNEVEEGCLNKGESRHHAEGAHRRHAEALNEGETSAY